MNTNGTTYIYEIKFNLSRLNEELYFIHRGRETKCFYQ